MSQVSGATPIASGLGRKDSLANGVAGAALLRIEHARSGETDGWDVVHQWLVTCASDPVTAHPRTAGLFSGAPAVSFAFHATGLRSYARPMSLLRQATDALIRHRLDAATTRADCGALPELAEWDLISGLTGLGVGLLYSDAQSPLLLDVLKYLVRLTQPVTINGGIVPGWWCPSPPSSHRASDWPGGHGNLGMAHGIAGPLAFMSITALRGITVPGQLSAIDMIQTWLDRWRVNDRRDAWWPGMISHTEWREGLVWQVGPQRPSWCYGTPGIARALQLAAMATRDQVSKEAAEAALAGCASDERQLSQVHDGSLCHGWAGLLQTLWRASRDEGPGGILRDLLTDIRRRLEHHLTLNRYHETPGLLEGEAGICLALHTVEHDTAPVTNWDACLLVSR